ncbi:MAG: hypothetical protein IIY81_01995 [Lachnospiraceae bacterium]|nr:hypothetical protein [Lachnospiraceae bacterium]
MQYLIKEMMICISNMILGAFLGTLLEIGYTMMIGMDRQIQGMLLFFGCFIVGIVYSILLKKFVLGKELKITLPIVFMLLGVWIGWNFSVY